MAKKKVVNEIAMDDTGDESGELDYSGAKLEIVSQAADEPIDKLYRERQRGRLIMQPDFQRNFVWDKPKASRLVESALMGIPLPVIYLAEEDDGRRSIIDGQQRLTSFFSFIDGKFPDGAEFKLGNLSVFKQCSNKAYSELAVELQDRINDCIFRTVTFKKGSDPDLKYNVFERLNTATVQLNAQELRNCIFRGPYNDLIKELAKDAEFRSILGLTESDVRMADVQLVLRYCAFLNKGYTSYGSSMKQFMNDEITERQNLSTNKANEIRKCFKTSVSLVKSMLGPDAFHRYIPGSDGSPDGRIETKQFNVALYDILMVCFARCDKNQVMANLDAIRESFIDMQATDIEFIEWMRVATSTAKSIRCRFDSWRKRLESILDESEKQPRCFTRKLKEKLFEKDPTCAICGQRIQSVDDAAVDHIEQYWAGGKTIPENARLAHRYCNCARPKDDVVA